ncbi:ADP/ATP-dependent (S)-NAD(P)H-hydrate dehydratase [Microbacterium sp. X-17]|uniref:ADP-dependent NAD(P)H-hydrate dehydratase n=1 Tax=Microbacterium sp. X-17 TaxID=3144404 RepID=UPI0031F550BD
MVPVRDWDAAAAERWYRDPVPEDDKYARGVVGFRTGSERYPGAAVLGVEAAWRTGIGMVRYPGPRRAADLVLARRPETVTADGRVQAWVVGSGTDAADRPEEETAALREILDGSVPVVADAGALVLAARARAPRLLTPHASEHDRLRVELGLAPAPARNEASRLAAVRETAHASGAVVLLKGAVTLVAAPSGWTARVEAGTPWLATAGTGDVLAGVLGALVAAHQDAAAGDAEALAALAATGAWLHGQAARLAVAASGGPIVALDVAEALPRAVAVLRAHGTGEPPA